MQAFTGTSSDSDRYQWELEYRQLVGYPSRFLCRQDDLLETFQAVDLIERMELQGAKDWNQNFGSNSVQGSLKAPQAPFRPLHLCQHLSQNIRVVNFCWIPDSRTGLQKPAIQPPA